MTAAKERPILFSGSMVRALLAGQKTQTRRIVTGVATTRDGVAYWPGMKHGGDFLRVEHCPYGVPGDRLWVRETWAALHEGERVAVYRESSDFEGPWRPSIFMPRWASRITLELLEVRVERLQDIDADSIWEEGIRTPATSELGPELRRLWVEGWDALNAKRAAWATNPWVWALRFAVLPKGGA